MPTLRIKKSLMGKSTISLEVDVMTLNAHKACDCCDTVMAEGSKCIFVGYSVPIKNCLMESSSLYFHYICGDCGNLG